MLLFSIVTIIMFLCFVQTYSILKSNLKITTKTQITEKMKTLWTQLFQAASPPNCSLNNPVKLAAVNDDVFGKSSKKKGKFYWVKHWGFDGSAYLFDFIDPVLRAEVCAEFKLIYKEVFALPTVNPKKNATIIVNGVKQKPPKDPNELFDPWDDPYDMAKLPPKQAQLVDFDVHKISVNTIQLNQALKKYRWNIDTMAANPGKKMVSDHDFNNDGRLSVRELIIAVLRNNDKKFGTYECDLCFRDIVDKIDAIFTFIDCDNNGLISASEMYESLQHLKRPTRWWNYFTLAPQAKIRTHVTNDFVLKNMSLINGNLTKEEFRRGILYGFWDRQTDDLKILDDDSKNLKILRWRGFTVDVGAEKYINDVNEAEIKRTKEALK